MYISSEHTRSIEGKLFNYFNKLIERSIPSYSISYLPQHYIGFNYLGYEKNCISKIVSFV